jgi:tRNA dimethylallyltransferase
MESGSSKKIIVVLGPTSSGKSNVAIRLAKKLDGEIISADSRQIYRGMNIGTGKVEAGQSAEIPKEFSNRKLSSGSRGSTLFFSKGIRHHMIDIVNPKTRFSVAQFKKKADKIIPDILKRGKVPIICGGTGFWIKAIVDNVTYPEVKPDWKLRNKLRDKTDQELFQMLKKLDPRRAKNIDRNNKVRLIRAIEICKKINFVPPLPPGEGARRAGEGTGYHFLQIGINLPKDKLQKNIKKRLKQRFEAGLPRVGKRSPSRVEAGMIKEVEKLKKQGLSWKKILSFGLGYFWIPKYLKGEIKTKEELFEKVFQAEKDYAKRQMTWFGKDKRIVWLKNYKEIEKEAMGFFHPHTK